MSSQSNDGMIAENIIETLYSHPDVKIISFSAATEESYQISEDNSINRPNGLGSLSWSSHLERTIAVGSLKIFRATGSVAFLSCGAALQPILPKSQCWCVDNMASKFVLQIRRPQYWRIELPITNAEEHNMSQALIVVFEQILQFEKTPCPFRQPFVVELPKQPDTPPRKKKWMPVSPPEVHSNDRPENTQVEASLITSSPTSGIWGTKLSPPSLIDEESGVPGSQLLLDGETIHSESEMTNIGMLNERARNASSLLVDPHSTMERKPLPISRIATLRELFEKLFLLSAANRAREHQPRPFHEWSPSILTSNNEYASLEAPVVGELSRLALTRQGIITTESPSWEVNHLSGEFASWMKDRLDKAVGVNANRLTALPSQPTKTSILLASANSSGTGITSTATNVIESRFSLHSLPRLDTHLQNKLIEFQGAMPQANRRGNNAKDTLSTSVESALGSVVGNGAASFIKLMTTYPLTMLLKMCTWALRLPADIFRFFLRTVLKDVPGILHVNFVNGDDECRLTPFRMTLSSSRFRSSSTMSHSDHIVSAVQVNRRQLYSEQPVNNPLQEVD